MPVHKLVNWLIMTRGVNSKENKKNVNIKANIITVMSLLVLECLLGQFNADTSLTHCMADIHDVMLLIVRRSTRQHAAMSSLSLFLRRLCDATAKLPVNCKRHENNQQWRKKHAFY